MPCTLKAPEHLFVGRESKNAEKGSHREAAFPVYFYVYAAVRIGFYLDPYATGGDYLCGKIIFSFVGDSFEKDSVRARELRHDNALDAIYDERAVRGHP